TQRFTVVLADDAVVQLDDLVACSQDLPDGRAVTHFGIVVEAAGHIEGATFATDTARIARDATMPGVTARRAEVQILRSRPELWLAPAPGAEVRRAAGTERDQALFVDQMQSPLAVGLDQSGEPVFVDFAFLNGEKGGHVNISGISGVATKTSYALFLLYQLLETPQGRALLGTEAPNTHALVFNVKGEDLLQIDRPNARFPGLPDAAAGFAALGVADPGAFQGVLLYAPRAAGARAGSIAPDVQSRSSADVAVYGWSPADFVRRGLLRFCFADPDDARTQVGFVEQRARVQLARHAWPLAGEAGALVMAEAPSRCSYNFDRVVAQARPEREAGEGTVVRDFSDLVDFLTARIEAEDHDWLAGVQPGTAMAFLRRLYALTPRLGHLVTAGVHPVDLQAAAVSVVDIHTLHQAAQRFVVGALLDEVFEAKQGHGREPLRFVVLDELNKYCPREGTSPLKELLVDIAERGRSLGVLLIGAQQAASAVDPAVTRNAAVKVVGRLDAAESAEYRFLTAEIRQRATRFLPGTMVLDQPLIPAPIPLRFPFPAFATNVAEGRAPAAERAAGADALFDRLRG
ncbi:MAG: ATP-binding protein, partial [Acidimicrobiales bacterium]